ncbi:TetR/AcrR family transcriptional regulator [Paractinoplanes maris]|uniref:TetR/AcrR family transcriptional regulator n=1 Tax=Paractinoplanes maris TaxID=1734446 RepID=UPI002021BA40|nr:TetR/AcrR family transcriptional regulator [Actinoplanes maris]
MPRPSKQEIDDEILEAAATLFARHGFKETSVQRIADAVGYSKTGLLHRYPTKESLQQAVLDRVLRDIRAVADEVAAMPPGPVRDRAVITSVARLAAECPGTVALLLSGLAGSEEGELGTAMECIGEPVFEAFAVDPETDPVRAIRVVGALGALAVAGVALREKPLAATLDDLIDISYDALGHER